MGNNFYMCQYHCCHPNKTNCDQNELGTSNSNIHNKSTRTENKIETEIDFNKSKITAPINQTYDQLTHINNINLVKDKAQILLLEILASLSIKKGTKINIGPFGIIPGSSNDVISLRNKNDGFVYFGYIPTTSPSNKNNNIIDIQLPPKDPENSNISINNNNTSANHYLGRYFQISFNPEHLKYYLMDCGGGIETFIKIQSETLLKDKTIINIGNSYITVSIGFEEDTLFPENADSTKKIPSLSNKDYNNNLNLKIENKNVVYDPINFQPTKSAIRIGRNELCEVVVEDHLLSRIHCTIKYRNNIGWVIRDGAYNRNKEGDIEFKASTNGSWILALEEMPIYEGMVFKYGLNLFRCSYSKQNE